MNKLICSNSLSPKFQLLSIAIFTSIIFYITYIFMQRFCASDERPDVFAIQEKIKEFKKEPASVEVGMTIENFSDFDTRNNKITFSGMVWFVYDPSLVSDKVIENFTFGNNEKLQKSLSKSFSIDGKAIKVYSIRATVKTDLYFGYFPFEDHRIYIVLENKSVGINELIFKSDKSNFIVNENSSFLGWVYINKEVDTGHILTKFGEAGALKDTNHPAVLFEIDYLYQGVRFILAIFFPLFLIFFIELMSFCLDQKEDHGTLITISLTDLAALLAYRFVLESIIPRVGYLTIADYVFFLFLSTSFIMFIINVIGPYLKIWHKKVISISLQLYVLFVFIFLFNFWFACV